MSLISTLIIGIEIKWMKWIKFVLFDNSYCNDFRYRDTALCLRCTVRLVLVEKKRFSNEWRPCSVSQVPVLPGPTVTLCYYKLSTPTILTWILFILRKVKSSQGWIIGRYLYAAKCGQRYGLLNYPAHSKKQRLN